jgi:hypothetical protein
MKACIAASTVFVVLLCGQQSLAQAATPCAYTSGVLQSSSLILDQSTQVSSCYTTPQTVRLVVHEIRLCEQEPNASNYLSSCESLVSSTSGSVVEIGVSGAPIALDDGLSLPTAEFSHAVVVFSNEVGVKHTETFDADQTGFTSSGRTCATRLVTASESQGASYVTCGTAPTAPAAQFLTEAFYQVDPSAACGDYDPNGLTGDVKFCLLADTSTLASNLQVDQYIDTRYLMAVQRFSTPVNISEVTRELRVSFGITDALSIEEDGGEISYFIGAFQLSVSAQ